MLYHYEDSEKFLIIQNPETPTAKARWVLEYLNFQYITNDIKTNLFLQDFY